MQTINYNYLELKPGSSVLDLGCGEGRHSIGQSRLPEACTVLGFDLCLDDINKAKSKAREHLELCQEYSLDPGPVPYWVNGNGLQLPFADNSFDLVICSEVLEHIPDYQGLLKELQRVLKPGGQFALSVPRQWPERLCWSFSDEYSKTPGGHIRIFDANKLTREVQALGFSKRGQHWAHALHSPYWWLKCLLWDKPNHPLVRAYHRLLVWDLLKAPWITRTLEQVLNPVMGKSVVIYFQQTDGTP